MQLENLRQPGFNTTLMGVLRGVLDYYEIPASDAMLYGGSGHAFLVNIHEQICPSGPYVWKYDGLYPLLRNLGIEMTDLGFFHGGSTPGERAAVEAKLKSRLDEGHPCSLANMENQLVTGYDDSAFSVARPWDCVDEKVAPPRLTFGTWQEFGDECHVNFFAFDKGARKDDLAVLRDSLLYAVDLFRTPDDFSFDKYGIGPKAYDNWAAGMEEHGATHGNWWNATVWSECRARAADYFSEMAGTLHGDAAALCRDLAGQYREISGTLARVADKELGIADKTVLIPGLKQRELDAVGHIDRLAGLLA